MRMYDLIEKKRDGHALSAKEISYIVDGYVKGEIPDYQMASMFMAIYFQGMTDEETWMLTQCMVDSGEKVDLSAISGVKVDKHSTGGVGDKTTLIAGPIVAACGVKVAKMSGRGLGFTGGTIDKLESIPGFRTSLDKKEFERIVNEAGICVIGQSGNLAPADKKFYALRDVTATVGSIPLIASSIMSKKIAAGSDCILLDVKLGTGAFMKNYDDALRLARTMVEIGEASDIRTCALITNMDIPLGSNIGNMLEVAEAVDVLQGRGSQDLREVSIHIAANMLYLAGKGTMSNCMYQATEALESKKALVRLYGMVKAQGGDTACIENPSILKPARYSMKVTALKSGYISAMNTEDFGAASVALGAGRQFKEDIIDYTAGIIVKARAGQYVMEGDEIAHLYSSRPECLSAAKERCERAVTVSNEAPAAQKLIFARVEKDKVEEY